MLNIYFYRGNTDSYGLILCTTLPSQPHLINKYQIEICFSYFHEIVILSSMNILASYQIDIVILSSMNILASYQIDKGCGFCNLIITLIWYWFLFYQQIIVFKMKSIFICYFISLTHHRRKYLKRLSRVPFNSTFKLKFSCSSGDECNLVYNKNSNNCALVNQ